MKGLAFISRQDQQYIFFFTKCQGPFWCLCTGDSLRGLKWPRREATNGHLIFRNKWSCTFDLTVSLNFLLPALKFWTKFVDWIYSRYGGADKSIARSGRKQANVSVRMAWISFGALPCMKKLDASSRLHVVEIARVPEMLPSLFLPGQAKDLSAPRQYRDKHNFYYIKYMFKRLFKTSWLLHVSAFFRKIFSGCDFGGFWDTKLTMFSNTKSLLYIYWYARI